ncbi:YfhO family protein [Bifidobacterium imperatoris]|uniref:Bacterial membrane protein YfhO n=1 Tax=Bifidobacterium imperatoris TaxID=2020965 RepID=A0A2N5IUZ7_9BIFI|nr:YfhO family protein [Bifidobacterium imperatoris]PLS25781.1 Bacterial membrane protein YfhO [Bifidobacterium imperatoris]QSY58261.1 YfhO family protein [Bifidobacterium imperatoris]
MSSSSASAPTRTTRISLTIAGYLACFALPIVLLIVLCMMRGIYPFGNESFLSGDLRYQYVDFFVWFRSILLGQGGNLMYSFAQGMGVGIWGLYSFYLASPLNLFVVFFDTAHITLFIWLVVAVKLGLAEMSMVFLLRRRFQLNGISAAALSLGYVFGSWTVSNLRNPMWLDNLVLLPLVCWATYEYINRRHWRMLAALLTVSVIICWYTAYMTIFFLVFYAVLEQMALAARTGTRFRDNDLWRKVLGMAGCGVLALLLSMWTFLPTIKVQSSSQGAMSSRIRGILDQAQGLAGGLITKLLPMLVVAGVLVVLIIAAVVALIVVRARRNAAVRQSAEHVKNSADSAAKVRTIAVDARGAGSSAALAMPEPYAHTVAWRVCVALFVLGCAGMVAISFAVPVIGHLWDLGTHADLKGVLLGFTATGWQEQEVPQLFMGAVVTVLAVLFFLLPSINRSVRKTAAVILLFILASTTMVPLEILWCGLRYPKGFYSRPAIYAAFFMVLLAAAALQEILNGRVLITRRLSDAGKRTLTRIVAAVIIVIAIPEFLFAANHTASVAYRDYQQTYADTYTANSRTQADRLRSLDGGVYRFEKNYTRAGAAALNEGMASGFRQLSIYSSANSAAAVDLLSRLGYSQVDENLTRYAAPSLLSDALLGVKYVSLNDIADSDGKYPNQYLGMQRVLNASGDGAAAVYRNQNALPLAYGVPADIAESDMPQSANPFENQNAFASALVGRKVTPFKQVEATAVDNAGGSRTWTVQVPKGSVGYVYVSTSAAVDFGLSIDGGGAITENNRFEHAMHPLVSGADSTQTAGTHTVTLTSPTGTPITGDQAAATCLFTVLDMSEVHAVTSQLAQSEFNIQEFEDGYVRGTFTAQSDSQSLMITTPYSDGWHVTVNGKKVEAKPAFGGAVTVIPVQAGTNDVETRFTSPGLVPGAVISAVTAAACIAIAVTSAMRRRKR